MKASLPNKYYAKAISRTRWHVIGPSGLPVYDGAPYGNDKPLLFDNEDAAIDYANRCNENIDEDNHE